MALGLACCVLIATAQAPSVIVEDWSSADVAAVNLLLGLDRRHVPRGREGLPALYAELLLDRMNTGLSESGGPSRDLILRLPSRRGIDLDRRRDYLALTVNTTSEGVLPALQFLTRYVLEAKFSGADVERARERVLKRRDIWLSSLVEPTEDLLVRAMWNGSAGTALYGEAESLGAIQLADVERFQATVVSRGNTWLSLVGTGDKATAREEAEQALATLPESAAMLSQPRLGLGGQVVVEDNALLDRASLAVGAPLPPFGTREHWAGWLVREMLAGPRGRLYQDRLLAARMGLALPSNLSWEQWPIIALPIQLGRYPYLAVYTLCYPPRVEVAREGILRHLADIGEERFGADEIELARCRVVNQWARELAAPRDRAKLLALAAMLETTLPSPDEVHATVSDIEPHEVAEVARSVVRRASVGIQMPRS